MQIYQGQKTKSSLNKLNYISVRSFDIANTPSISLSPLNSDIVDNQTILNSLVATLVKYSSTGKIEPYLAEKWQTSEDEKTWTFTIKKGFTCESGQAITAASFKTALIGNFKRNLTKSDKTEFNLLQGWEDFHSNKSSDLIGLTVDDNNLIFNFKKAPTGILNFLRMPYFGHWCEANFINNVFRADNNFSSSGPYKLEKVLSKSRVLLKIRNDQASFNSEAPQLLEIGYGAESELSNFSETTIVKTLVADNVQQPTSSIAIDGAPVILQGLVLHNNSDFFKNEHNRKVFAKKLFLYEKNNPTLNFSKGFYLTSTLKKESVLSYPDQYNHKTKEKIKIALQYMPISLEIKNNFEKLFAITLEGVPFEIIYPDSENPNWVKSIINNPEYSIRTSFVYAGATHVLSTIKMMFCSNLGISFPDPSRRVCELVNDYTENNKEVDDFFIKKFDSIIVEDSSVFPLVHSKDRWLVTKDLDLETIPKLIIHPLFEKIRLK